MKFNFALKASDQIFNMQTKINIRVEKI